MRKNRADFNEIMKLNGWKMFNAQYRAMLNYISPECYVEASSTGQHGTVKKVIRNRSGVPVCVKVDCSEDVYMTDYISIDRIDFFEPYDCYTSSEWEYCDRGGEFD